MTVHDADNPEDIKQIIQERRTYSKVYIWVWSNFFEVREQYLFILSLTQQYIVSAHHLRDGTIWNLNDIVCTFKSF